MKNRTEGSLRFLIADPDQTRRGRIMAHAPAGAAIEAASLSEAFDLAESQRPDAIALCADITGDAGLDMFLHLVDALSISFVVYGDRARDRTPERLRKSISFIPFAAQQTILNGFSMVSSKSRGTSPRPTGRRAKGRPGLWLRACVAPSLVGAGGHRPVASARSRPS